MNDQVNIDNISNGMMKNIKNQEIKEKKCNKYVLQVIKHIGIKFHLILNWKKYHFLKKKIKYLRHIIENDYLKNKNERLLQN